LEDRGGTIIEEWKIPLDSPHSGKEAKGETSSTSNSGRKSEGGVKNLTGARDVQLTKISQVGADEPEMPGCMAAGEGGGHEIGKHAQLHGKGEEVSWGTVSFTLFSAGVSGSGGHPPKRFPVTVSEVILLRSRRSSGRNSSGR